MTPELVLPTVTRLLSAHLADGLRKRDRSNVAVSTVPLLHPTAREVGAGQRLNLCLFDVIMPPRTDGADRGAIDDRDAVAESTSLDLLFVLSSHGGSELSREVILGHGMDLLRELRQLDRSGIRNTIERTGAASPSAPGPEHMDVVAAALASEVEEIQVHPEPGRLQDLNRIWSELLGPVAPSVPYRVVVRLGKASEHGPAQRPTLEQERRSQAQPVIHSVRARAASNLPIIEDPFVTTGQQLVIDGRFHGAEEVRVWLGLDEIRPAPEDISSTRVAVTVPPNVRAGVRDVVVACSYTPRTPGVRPRIATSNLATFVLQPLLDPWSISFESGYITLVVKPRIGGDQRVTLLLNEWEPSVDCKRRPRAYNLRVPPRMEDSNAAESERDEVAVPIAGVPPGTYLVRLQVDGAKSPLGVVAGDFAFPRITIP